MIDFDDTADTDAPELASGMNITPLIDVLLVLLVMLIITIPITLHSVNMQLPAGAPPPGATLPPVVRIEITEQNRLLWNGEALPDQAELQHRLRLASGLSEQPEIHVLPARHASYDVVAQVLSASQRQGLQKIGVVGLDDY